MVRPQKPLSRAPDRVVWRSVEVNCHVPPVTFSNPWATRIEESVPPLLIAETPILLLSVRMYAPPVGVPPVKGLPVTLMRPVPPLLKESEPNSNGFARSLVAVYVCTPLAGNEIAVAGPEAGTPPLAQFVARLQLPVLVGSQTLCADTNCTDAANPAAAVMIPMALEDFLKLRMFLQSRKPQLTSAPTRAQPRLNSLSNQSMKTNVMRACRFSQSAGIPTASKNCSGGKLTPFTTEVHAKSATAFTRILNA